MDARDPRVGKNQIGCLAPADLQSQRADDVLHLGSVRARGQEPVRRDLGGRRGEELCRLVDFVVRFSRARWARTFRQGGSSSPTDAFLVTVRSTRDRLTALYQPFDVAQEHLPGRIVLLPLPVREVDSVCKLEDDRPVAGFDDHRHELVAPVRQSGFRPDPAGFHRPRRPQHNHRLRGSQLLFDDLVERFTRMQGAVPPNAKAFFGKRLREPANYFAVLSAVRDEDVRLGQLAP